jgi:hypothetical protein
MAHLCPQCNGVCQCGGDTEELEVAVVRPDCLHCEPQHTGDDDEDQEEDGDLDDDDFDDVDDPEPPEEDDGAYF